MRHGRTCCSLSIGPKLRHELADAIVRYWTDSDDAGICASAAETRDLFRALAAANPESAGARRAAFVWAWTNAKITNGISMWKESLDQARWLEARRKLKGREALLAEAQRKMEIKKETRYCRVKWPQRR